MPWDSSCFDYFIQMIAISDICSIMDLSFHGCFVSIESMGGGALTVDSAEEKETVVTGTTPDGEEIHDNPLRG